MRRAILATLLALPLVAGGCAPPPQGPVPPSGPGLVAGTLAGTVAYRERIALPADAVVRVAIVEVAKADAPSRTIAEARVPAGGRQVPIPFTLAYPADRPGDHAEYAVQARIEAADGTLMFITDTRTPLPANGEVALWLVTARR